MPGFQTIAAPGHRTDHIALLISSAGQQLLHVSDAVRHPVQVAHPDWSGFIDSFPAEAATTCRSFVERAAAEELLVFTTHVAFPGLGYVRRSESGYVWEAFELKVRFILPEMLLYKCG